MSANKSQIGGGKYKQGKYKVINESKYTGGNVNDVVYRSSWELVFTQYLDLNESIIKWGAEVVVIPYTDRKGKIRRYYTDFYYEKKINDHNVERVVVELKPHAELSPPSKPKNETSKALENYLYALETYTKNLLKWDTAQIYCSKRHMKFIIITEKHLKKSGLL